MNTSVALGDKLITRNIHHKKVHANSQDKHIIDFLNMYPEKGSPSNLFVVIIVSFSFESTAFLKRNIYVGTYAVKIPHRYTHGAKTANQAAVPITNITPALCTKIFPFIIVIGLILFLGETRPKADYAAKANSLSFAFVVFCFFDQEPPNPKGFHIA
jgi:hypothetical protein